MLYSTLFNKEFRIVKSDSTAQKAEESEYKWALKKSKYPLQSLY